MEKFRAMNGIMIYDTPLNRVFYYNYFISKGLKEAKEMIEYAEKLASTGDWEAAKEVYDIARGRLEDTIEINVSRAENYAKKMSESGK